MQSEDARKQARRKPTLRGQKRKATVADAHYSKLTHKMTATPQGKARSAQPKASASRRNAQRSTDPKAVTTYQTLTEDARKRVYGKRGARKRHSGNAAASLIGIAVVAAFITGGVFFWNTRPVSVTLNGSEARLRIHSDLDAAFAKAGVETAAGNYVSVGGTLLKEGTGYQYGAVVDGTTLEQDELEQYRIKGGEAIEFTDGADRMEDYDVTYREVQPKLLFQGSTGAVSFVKQWGKAGRQEIRTGKQSHETADGAWADEVRDGIVVTKNITPEGGKKLVALTFADGPSAAYTEQCLDILAEHDAKATFFALSPNVADNPAIAQKIVASGNQICSHTNQHLQLTTLGPDELLSEITSAHDTIKEVSGVDTTIIRPPYGDFSQDCWLATKGAVCASITCTQDSADEDLPGADAIAQNALSNVQPGSIILLHDGGGERAQTVEALPRIIDELENSGYTLVTVSELLDSDPEVPDAVVAGDARMPSSGAWPTEIGQSAIDVG